MICFFNAVCPPPPFVLDHFITNSITLETSLTEMVRTVIGDSLPQGFDCQAAQKTLSRQK